MTRAAALLFASVLTLCGATDVDAQSRTDVQVLDLSQIQDGTSNTQRVGIGNAYKGNETKVTVESITQTQSGSHNTQKINIGNARGGSTNVIIGKITQTQSGNSGTQRMNIGNTGEIDDDPSDYPAPKVPIAGDPGIKWLDTLLGRDKVPNAGIPRDAILPSSGIHPEWDSIGIDYIPFWNSGVGFIIPRNDAQRKLVTDMISEKNLFLNTNGGMIFYWLNFDDFVAAFWEGWEDMHNLLDLLSYIPGPIGASIGMYDAMLYFFADRDPVKGFWSLLGTVPFGKLSGKKGGEMFDKFHKLFKFSIGPHLQGSLHEEK